VVVMKNVAAVRDNRTRVRDHISGGIRGEGYRAPPVQRAEGTRGHLTDELRIRLVENPEVTSGFGSAPDLK